MPQDWKVVEPGSAMNLMQMSQGIGGKYASERRSKEDMEKAKYEQQQALFRQMLGMGQQFAQQKMQQDQQEKITQMKIDAAKLKPQRPVALAAGGKLVDPQTGEEIARGRDKPGKDFIAPGILENLDQFQGDIEEKGKIYYDDDAKKKEMVKHKGFTDLFPGGRKSLFRIVKGEFEGRGFEPAEAGTIARLAVSNKKAGKKHYVAQAYADFKTTAAKKPSVKVESILSPPVEKPAPATTPTPAPQQQAPPGAKMQIGQVVDVPSGPKKGKWVVKKYDKDGEPILEKVSTGRKR